jgi:hypothetical protein
MQPKLPNVNTHFVKKIISDKDAESLKGSYQGEEICDTIFNENIDVYIESDEGTKLLAKFRKRLLPAQTVKLGWDCFHKMARQSLLRGAASGPVDISGAYYKDKILTNTKVFSTSYIRQDGKQSKMQIGNAVASAVVGYMDTGRFNNQLPCRLSAYTAKHMHNYQRGIGFISAIDAAYKLLLPEYYSRQKEQADKKPDLRIADTAFSTVTINRNFRTGAHQDAGDYPDGFGNLTVIERGDYNGGYTIFPQFSVGFDVRSGDVLLMDVHQLHCNTEIIETPEQAEANAKLPKTFKPSKVIGGDKNYTRLSFVCYLRQGLADCPDV